ncbi:MAG: TPM domain-containing protein, partial [Acidobacteria bacterium]
MGHLTLASTKPGQAVARAREDGRGGVARRFALLALVCLLANASPFAQELPELTRPVNDFAGVVDAASATEMDRVIRALQQASGDVITVATVQSIAPYGDIREYAVKLFENRGRGIGEKGKHNGLLVLLSVKDREVRVEVGYGLEEFITDGFAGETSRNYMAPAFRAGQFGEGLRAGVARIAGRIAEGRGITLEGVEPVRAARRGRNATPASLIVVGIIVLFVILQFLNGGGGRRGGFRRSRTWGAGPWSGWNSGVGPFGGG